MATNKVETTFHCHCRIDAHSVAVTHSFTIIDGELVEACYVQVSKEQKPEVLAGPSCGVYPTGAELRATEGGI